MRVSVTQISTFHMVTWRDKNVNINYGFCWKPNEIWHKVTVVHGSGSILYSSIFTGIIDKLDWTMLPSVAFVLSMSGSPKRLCQIADKATTNEVIVFNYFPGLPTLKNVRPNQHYSGSMSNLSQCKGLFRQKKWLCFTLFDKGWFYPRLSRRFHWHRAIISMAQSH